MSQTCKFFLMAMSILVCANHQMLAQANDSWKNEKITVRVSNEKLGAVIEKVAQMAKATVVFQNVTLIGINQPTTLNVKDIPLDKVIGQLIGNQNVKVRYESNRQIIFESYEKPKADTQQSFYISGAVTGADNGEALIGATVMITEGTGQAGTAGCITDADGKFSLHIKNKQSIKVSYIGYESQSIQVTRPQKNMKIALKPSAVSMDEVVVTGISKRKKSSFTGNFISVKGAELRKINPTNMLKGLQFFDPSFKVVENNAAGSDPNAVPEFQMRGDQSLGGKSMSNMDLMLDNVSSRPNTPLFVLDGFVVSMNRVLELDPERVESITVLKDAAATSVYGSRASNGVVVVETVVAPDGALSVSYNGSMTLQTPDLTDYNMMNAAEKLAFELKAGEYNLSDDNAMNRYNMLLRNVLAGVDTYWMSQPLRTSLSNRHSLVAAGGTDVFRYNLGVNANFNPGVMKGSSNNTKGVNLTMSYRKDKMVVGANIDLSEVDGNNSPYGSFSQYTSINQYYRMKNDNGEYDQILDNHTGASGSTMVTNPLYNANVGMKNLSNSLTIRSSLNLEYQMLENLRFTEQLSYTRRMARTEVFKPADHTDFAQTNDVTLKGSYSKSTGEMASWSSNLGVNYNAPINKHLISLFANWTISEDRNNYVNLFATGYPDKNMDDFIFGNKMSQNPSGTEALSRSMGLIGQFSYSYDNRYSADFNISGEASSRYSDHNIVPFWSAGLRWNAFREKFLQGYVSNLVFRATYGITGEQSFEPYEAIEFYTFSGTMKPYKSFPMLGAVLAGLNNPDLGWAKTHNFSAGIDFGFWKNRVNATFNYYNNITKQLLTNYDLAPSTGFGSQTMNAGELQNQGFDASLNVIAYQNLRKQIYWTVAANANHNKNKIRKISDYLRKVNEKQLASTSAPLPIYQEGQSTTTLYTVKSLGIDPVTGREVYLKRNGEKTFIWDSNDKVPVGDTNPTVSGTFSSSLNWKDFSASLGFTYRWGGVVYNQTLVDKVENSSLARNLDKRAAQNRWEKPGDIAMYKKVVAGGSETPQSSRFIMDDDELKLASLAVGYRFQNDRYAWLNKMNIDVLSLNFTTNDLFTISRIRRERGLDYPFTRSYTLSLSVIFK